MNDSFSATLIHATFSINATYSQLELIMMDSRILKNVLWTRGIVPAIALKYI